MCERVLQQLVMTRQAYGGNQTYFLAGNPPLWLSDSWRGDSGGPLLVPGAGDATTDMQLGIVSFGEQGSVGERL